MRSTIVPGGYFNTLCRLSVSGGGTYRRGDYRAGGVFGGNADVGAQRVKLGFRQSVNLAEVVGAAEFAPGFAIAHDVACHPPRQSHVGKVAESARVGVEGDGCQRAHGLPVPL